MAVTMKRFCAVCSKHLEIVVQEDGSYTGGRHWAFNTSWLGGEYWECDECYNRKDDD